MNLRTRYFAAALLLLTLHIQACKPEDSDGDGIADARDKCPAEKGLKPDGCPARKDIRAVRFFLETSGSMGGYFKGNAEFPAVISDLTAKIDKSVKPIEIYFVAETTERFNGSPQALSREIANRNVTPQKSSQLHKIIAGIADRTDSSDISLLVSDCILSFTDAEIRKDPEINKNVANGTLKSDVYSTFADLNRKKGFGASMYAFRSRFNGTYYDYQNKKTELRGVPRPFYIWVIGNKELLAKFDAQLADISSFRPEQELHFGLADKAVSDFSILPTLAREGADWMESSEGTGIEDVGDPKKSPVQFCAGLNLSTLPPYARDVAYLQKNLKLDLKGCEATATVIPKSAADASKLRSEPQKAAFERCTHLLLVRVNSIALKNASISARLPLRYDTWFQDWSCMDDKNLAASCAGRTFALEHLVSGVRDAYETKNADYINITLTLKK
jgi:hypothetical protein